MVVKGRMKDDGVAQTPTQQFHSLLAYAFLTISIHLLLAPLITTNPALPHRQVAVL
jgi:hypothetical protein